MIGGIQFVQPFVYGVAEGAAFGLVAIGLVLIYKSSRVFNFAAGEFITLGAFGTYVFYRGWHLPYVVAIFGGMLWGAIAGLLTERLVVRPLGNRPKVTVLVATAAVAILLISLELMIGEAKPYNARPVFDKGLTFLSGVPLLGHLSHPLGPKLGNTYFSAQQMLIVASLVIAGVALAWFFGRTDLGLATLATSQEATASRLVGIRLNRISLMTWGAAGLLGGLAGVLLPPVTATFAAGFGTQNVLISAFTAAVLGGMTSVPGAFLGGLLLGLVQAFAQFDLNKVTGSQSIAVLVVLVIVLVVRPTGLLGQEA